MARIRTIKPEFWKKYRLSRELTRDERLFYIGMWNESDDEGRLLAHPGRLRGAIFPYEPDIDDNWVDRLLKTLKNTARAVLYEVNGEPFCQLLKFREHQSISHPQDSRIPAPPKKLLPGKPQGKRQEGSGSVPEGDQEGTGKVPRRNGMEGKGKDKDVDDRENWLAPYAEAWQQRAGGEPNYGALAKTMKRLERLGNNPEDVLRVWCYYLDHTDPQFYSAAAFSQKFGVWKKKATPGFSGYG